MHTLILILGIKFLIGKSAFLIGISKSWYHFGLRPFRGKRFRMKDPIMLLKAAVDDPCFPRWCYIESMKRYAGFMGTWYPGSRDGCLRITGDLDGSGDLWNAVLPHAGLMYSGSMIREYYEGMDAAIRRIAIISPSHCYRLQPDTLYISRYTEAETPFGTVPVLPLDIPGAITADEVIGKEHGVEMFLPFIGKKGNAAVSFAVISTVTSPEEAFRQAEALLEAVDGRTAFIASSDFTHYGARFACMPFGRDSGKAHDAVVRQDSEAARLLAEGRIAEVLERYASGTICGIASAVIVSAISSILHMQGRTGSHTTSMDISDDGDSGFVSYQTVYWRKDDR